MVEHSLCRCVRGLGSDYLVPFPYTHAHLRYPWLKKTPAYFRFFQVQLKGASGNL